MLVRKAAPLFALLLVLGLSVPSQAGITVYEEGDKKIEIGGRIQLQYARVDPSDGDAVDQVFFRRLRPYISGTVTENWSAKIQFDFGKSLDSDEVAVKDVFARYKGWENGTLTIGNVKPGFSRQFLTSSKRLQVVERGFVGDHNFGSPDRAIVIKYDGHNEKKSVTYSIAGGAAHHDPDARRLDFDTPTNNKSDWNEGSLFVGRLDFHPNGFMKFDRGNFKRDESKFNFSLAGFLWNNDGDNNSLTDTTTGLSTDPDKADLDESTGIELSAGYRGHGFSADAEFQTLTADAVDTTFTGGIYMNGSSDLDKASLNAGYMLPNDKVELVVGYDTIDADGYADEWQRTSFGLNLFLNKHKAKTQITYSMGENVFGVIGDDVDTLQVQGQFVF